MAFSLIKIRNTDNTSGIFDKGFAIQKLCGQENEGLIISLTVGYLDGLILAQNTEYNNSIFFKKA